MSGPSLKKKAGGTYFGNRLNTAGDVIAGVETRKHSDFLKNVQNHFGGFSTFEDVFEDEGDFELIRDSLEHDMGHKGEIKDADALRAAVTKCVAKVQSESLNDLKEEVEELLTEI